MKDKMKWLVVPGLMLGTSVLLLASGLRTAEAVPVTHSLAAVRSVPAPVKAPAPVVAPTVADNPAVLDAHRRFALGMIETGNDDQEIGGAGEVSRYQIMPSVWKHYSQSPQYQNPDVSLAVAQQHWLALYNAFKKSAHREPGDFDLYVLWNTRQGYYAGKGFNPDRLGPVVRDRAQRFVNLVHRDDQAYFAYQGR